MGSSGNSTDPHLHFELWYDSLYVVDPFTGPCGNPESLWLDNLPYDTSFGVFASGFKLKNELTIDDLRFRDSSYTSNLQIPPSSNASLNFWSHLYGLRTNDELRIQWLTPNNTEWFTFSTTVDQDYWYYYYCTFINHQDLEKGKWTARLFKNDSLVVENSFSVEEAASHSNTEMEDVCSKLGNLPLSSLLEHPTLEVELYSSKGQIIQKHQAKNIASLPKSTYIIRLKSEKNYCTLKRQIGLLDR